MEETYKIIYADEPAWGIIGPAIDRYNQQQAGEYHSQTLCFVLRSADEEIVGGVIGAIYWDWLQLELLWVKEELRGLGYGRRLLASAEEEARKRGAKRAYLDTFSFQAPDFYRRHGYHVFGTLQGFPAGHNRYFLQKELQGEPCQ